MDRATFSVLFNRCMLLIGYRESAKVRVHQSELIKRSQLKEPNIEWPAAFHSLSGLSCGLRSNFTLSVLKSHKGVNALLNGFGFVFLSCIRKAGQCLTEQHLRLEILGLTFTGPTQPCY